MKEVLIDCAALTDREALHETLEQVLEFPSWYGRNLDALYDCLTDIATPVHVTLTGLDALQNYGKKLRRVFLDAARENENLTIVCQ